MRQIIKNGSSRRERIGHGMRFDYDLTMPGVGRNSRKPLLVVVVLLFILIFVLARLGLLH
jgi:hypothetical protein